MAFNILNIGFSGSIASSFVDRSIHTSDGDNNDLITYIGQDFGAAPFTNAHTLGHITVTNNEGSGSAPDISNLLNRTSRVSNSGTNLSRAYGAILQCNNLIIQPTGIQILTNGSAATMTNINLDGSFDGTTWVELVSLPNQAIDSTWGPFTTINNLTFYPYLRFTWTQNNLASFGSPDFLAIYGRAKRTNGLEADQVLLPVTIDQLSDVDINSPQDGDYLFWDNGVVKHQREKLYETVRTTNDVILTDNQYLPNFYIITPTTTRTVDLPPNPTTGQFFRIRNLDNIFEVQIREPGPSVISTIGGSGGLGLTQADCYYDGTEWSIIQY